MDRMGFVPWTAQGRPGGAGGAGSSVRHRDAGPGACSAVSFLPLPLPSLGLSECDLPGGPSSFPALNFPEFGKV